MRNALLFCFVILCFRSLSVAQPLANNKSKYVGNVVSNGNSIRTNFKNYWNQVTPENAGKWGSVQGAVGSYNFGQLDNIYNYALANGFPFKLHTLVWGSQEPGHLGVLDSAAQYAEIVKWIDTTGKRYPLAAYCEVVNEPLHQPPSYKNALGGDGVTGWDWVIKAFELARASWSPQTKLLINEYSVINDGVANANYLAIVNLLKERGLVDGIGVQGHGFEIDAGASTTTLHNNLTSLAATGLPVYITELDINRADDSEQLQRYQAIFPTLYEHPGVFGITLWGYVQYDIWRPDAYLLTDRLSERPAMQWLRTYLAGPFRPILVEPNGFITVERNPRLIWSSPDTSTTSYRVQVSISSVFSSTALDTTVTDTSFQVEPLAAGTRYFWRAKGISPEGESVYSMTASFMTNDSVTTHVGGFISPEEFTLYQNFPNPFNPSTKIRFSVSRRTHVSLRVFDLLGRPVATMVDGVISAGTHEADFDAASLPGGTYICRLQAGPSLTSTKIVLIK